MLKFDIEIDGIDEIKNLIDAYPERAERSASRSINRALQQLSTKIAEDIVTKYNIKKSQIRSEVSFFKANQKKAEGELRFRKWGLFLDDFATKSALKKKPPVGLSVEIERGKKTLYQGSFFLRGRNSGKSLIVRRVGGAKLPVKRMVGIGVYQMIDKSKFQVLESSLKAKFLDEFRRQMEGDF